MIPFSDRNFLVVNADVRRPSETIGINERGRFVRGYNVHPDRGRAFGIGTVPDGPRGFDDAAIGDANNMPPVCHLRRHGSGVPFRHKIGARYCERALQCLVTRVGEGSGADVPLLLLTLRGLSPVGATRHAGS